MKKHYLLLILIFHVGGLAQSDNSGKTKTIHVGRSCKDGSYDRASLVFDWISSRNYSFFEFLNITINVEQIHELYREWQIPDTVKELTIETDYCAPFPATLRISGMPGLGKLILGKTNLVLRNINLEAVQDLNSSIVTKEGQISLECVKLSYNCDFYKKDNWGNCKNTTIFGNCSSTSIGQTQITNPADFNSTNVTSNSGNSSNTSSPIPNLIQSPNTSNTDFNLTSAQKFGLRTMTDFIAILAILVLLPLLES